MHNVSHVSRYFISATSVLLLMVFGCSSEQSESSFADHAQSELVKAPGFEVTTISGETMSLEKSMEEDKPLVVYFTASWCPTCARNWPALSELYPEYEDRLDLVAISIDPTDDTDVMINLAEERGFTFPSTKGYPQVMIDFGVSRQATTVGVNRDGYIEFVKSGAALSRDEFRTLFDELIN